MRKSPLNQHKQNKLIGLFIAAITEKIVAELVNVNKTTASYYSIFIACDTHLSKQPTFGDVWSRNRSVSGTRKGKNGRDTTGKALVFELLKRSYEIYTVTVSIPNTQYAIYANLLVFPKLILSCIWRNMNGVLIAT